MPMVAIVSLGIVANSWLGSLGQSVLGYATDMSVQSLLDDTNTQRQTNGETALHINSELTTAAQNKANDMAARDYWSHNTPDGKTPWTFITAAGYNYSVAGENLAYGFDTAAYTIDGWMNSPEHRANILNVSYKDVGFGIVNIPDYQSSGPETLVVAMYGALASTPVAASATPKTPTPALVAKPEQQTQHSSPAAKKTSVPTTSPIATSTPATAAKPKEQNNQNATLEPSQQRITRFQLVASSAPMNTLALGIFGLSAFGFVLVRHGWAWRKVLVHGEAFVLRHPILDIAAATLISFSIILSHTVGLIR